MVTGDPEVKRRIREAAEHEERENYEGGRLPEHWRTDLEPLGTDWRKPFLEIAPWIVVGAGGALTLVGGLVYLGGKSKVDDAEAICPGRVCPATEDGQSARKPRVLGERGSRA